MKNIILFDSENRDHLLPLTYTRPVADIRVGILTLREKWEHWLGGRASFIAQSYLNQKYPIHIAADNYVVNGSILPTAKLCELIEKLQNKEAIVRNGELIAARLDAEQFDNLMAENDIEELNGTELPEHIQYLQINRLWDIFTHNDTAIRSDFALLTKGRVSQPISATNQILGDVSQIFLEEGASVECSILNTKTGPIYVGKNAEIMEGCIVRGGLALCEHAVLKMGAKIYGATTVGPYSKIGGEVNNSVIFGFSNKGHDGFLGNSVLGEWCNMGADSNNSNLKNNYEEVRVWNYTTDRFEKTGLQFFGLIMGDHSKCGINTMFNTGTVIGVSSNIFGSGFPRNFIPSYCWGGAAGFETYTFKKAIETAERVMQRRNIELDEVDRGILQFVFDYSAKYRTWERQNTAPNNDKILAV